MRSDRFQRLARADPNTFPRRKPKQPAAEVVSETPNEPATACSATNLEARRRVE